MLQGWNWNVAFSGHTVSGTSNQAYETLQPNAGNSSACLPCICPVALQCHPSAVVLQSSSAT